MTPHNHNTDDLQLQAEIAYERRQELVSKVAVLESQAENTRDKLLQLERAHLLHQSHEEVIMREVENAMIALPGAIDVRIDKRISPIAQKVVSITELITKTQTVLWVLSGVGSIIIGVIAFFHEPIIKFLFH